MDRPASLVGRWRRLGAWRWFAVVVVAALAVVVVLGTVGDDESDDGLRACRAVLDAVRDADEGRTSVGALLDVVTRQAAVARAEADRDAAAAPVADAIEQMRVDLAAGRPWRTVTVLYGRCG